MTHPFKAAVLVSLLLLPSATTFAAQVVGHSPDNTGGRLMGGWSAFLIGAAAGGPAGALIAGAGGIWLGGKLQQACGLSGQLHHVRTDTGAIETVRSPKQFLPVGTSVVLANGRPQPAPTQ